MLINASAVDWANNYTGPLFHAMLCDPPYHLTSITERFGKEGSAPAQFGNDGAFARASRGFMNATWDGGDIAFQPSTWAAFRRILYPGAFGMAFASTRGFHRMAVAIEGITGTPINRLRSMSDLLGLALETRDWALVEQAKQLADDYIARTEAIAAAGFIIHPVIMCWAFGSGFPKATRVDVQIDNQAYRDWLAEHPAEAATRRAMAQALQAAEDSGHTDRADELAKQYNAFDKQLRQVAGVEPIIIGTKKHQPKFAAADFGYREKDNGFNSKDRESFELTSGATAESQAWGGHRYGMQVLKPALEPIIVFQKPYEGRPIDCITSTGAGTINIDGGRIGMDEDDRSAYEQKQRSFSGSGNTEGYGGFVPSMPHERMNTSGRWPSNLILSHHPECEQLGTRRVKGTKGDADYTPSVNQDTTVKMLATTIKTGRHYADSDGYETIADWQCVEACPVRRLGEQSGDTAISGAARNGKPATAESHSITYMQGATGNGMLHNDSGTASRYFYNADWMLDRLEQADPLIYEAKASTTEREAGLEGFANIANDHAVYNSDHQTVARCPEHDSPMDTSTKKNTYQCGCTVIRRTQFELTTINDGRVKSIDNPYQRGETQRRNPHPTIKPIALARHLATLLLPPAKYGPRRLFVPFAGVASEMIGAMLAGWEEVTGVELEADHMPVAQARIDYWQQMRYRLMNPDAPVKVTINRKVPAGQLSLFTEDET